VVPLGSPDLPTIELQRTTRSASERYKAMPEENVFPNPLHRFRNARRTCAANPWGRRVFSQTWKQLSSIPRFRPHR
jgi:hypothetical protein